MEELAQTVIKNDSVVAVRLEYLDPAGNLFEAEGIAKRNPVDPPDQVTGTDLATGRAFKKLGRQLEKNAWKRIAFADKKAQKNRPF